MLKMEDVSVEKSKILNAYYRYFKILSVYGFFPTKSTLKLLVLPYVDFMSNSVIKEILEDCQIEKLEYLQNCINKHCLL